MPTHKRLLLWLLAGFMRVLGRERFERLPVEHPRMWALVGRTSKYVNDQPTRYDLSGKQLFRAIEIRNLAAKHHNALRQEGAPGDRLQQVAALYVLAEREANTAIEADRLNLGLEVSDIQEEAGP